jgi:hypothetical protein
VIKDLHYCMTHNQVEGAYAISSHDLIVIENIERSRDQLNRCTKQLQ